MISEYAFARLPTPEQERLLKLFSSRPPRTPYTQLQVAILYAIRHANARHATGADLFKADMEALFGTEEACGVLFEVDDAGPQTILTMAEYKSLPKPDTITHLANGGDGCCCTHYAYLVHQRLPGRVQIYGFANEDNPTAMAVKECWHPGGHDFAVVDDRYIVDPWVRHVHFCHPSRPIVYDLQDQETTALYGPRTAWTLNTEAAPFYDQHLKPITPTSHLLYATRPLTPKENASC